MELTRSGDQCRRCLSGRLFVYASKPHGPLRVRYLRCDRCRRTAGKQVVRESDIHHRRSVLNAK